MGITEEKLASYSWYRFLVLMFTNSCWLQVDGKWVKHTFEEPEVSEWQRKHGYKNWPKGKSWGYDEY